jgi:hypothetical protein
MIRARPDRRNKTGKEIPGIANTKYSAWVNQRERTRSLPFWSPRSPLGKCPSDKAHARRLEEIWVQDHMMQENPVCVNKGNAVFFNMFGVG